MMTQISHKTTWIIVAALLVALLVLVWWYGTYKPVAAPSAAQIREANAVASQAAARRAAEKLAVEAALRALAQKTAQEANPLTVENPVAKAVSKAGKLTNPLRK